MKKLMGRAVLVIALLAAALSFGASTEVSAGEEECSFDKESTPNTWILQENCEVTSTVVIPDGVTLDGNEKTITAIDTGSSSFDGAIIQNSDSATEIHVTNLTIDADSPKSTGDFYGIRILNASGSITNSTIKNVRRADHVGAQEGRAIRVDVDPMDGTHPDPKTMLIEGNNITLYQKSGIDVRGDVKVTVHDNIIGASASDGGIAANAISFVNGAFGSIVENDIVGNQWLGAIPIDTATAILIYNSSNVEIRDNTITGNSDIAINIYGGESSQANTIANNTISDDNAIEDGPHGDTGIWDAGVGTTINGNTATGFDVPIINAYTGMCYTAWTGALRVASDCAPWEKALHLADSSVETIYTDVFAMCARDGNGLARYSPNGNCDSLWGWWDNEVRVNYPNTNLISICVDDDTGRVRVSSSCSGDEWAGQI